MDGEILMGNGAVARGLVEAGCHAVIGYPGTPSSEIMPEVVRFKKQHGLTIHTEWSVNEKVALEGAIAFAWSGLRVAVVMKQVGLNVAADPVMSSAYTGTVGGFLIISCDDPGPHSSQTEQDTREFARFAKLPVLDPSSPEEARNMVAEAFEISEKYEIPVILRPSIRICHARQWIAFETPRILDRPAEFRKDPGRFAATPKFRLILHHKLNEKLDRIAGAEGALQELNAPSGLNRLEGPKDHGPLGIVAGGPPLAHLKDLMKDAGLDLPLLCVGLSHPLDSAMLESFAATHERILVLEEPGPAIEMMFMDRNRILGRTSGHVPRAGELTPEKVAEILSCVLTEAGMEEEANNLQGDGACFGEALAGMDSAPRKPTLCPGCPHRSAFFAIRKALPKAVYTSDIGCYTLGINLRAVDTCVNMGASISMASGFDHAFRSTGRDKPIVATIGDSTFFHSGMTGLLNAVYTKARFILVILDNEVTAMTGMQPTPASGILADGSAGNRITLEEAVKGCGVQWLEIREPYDFEEMKKTLQEAHAYTRSEEGGVAVIISRAPCLIHDRSARERWTDNRVEIDPDICEGCGLCVKAFECPALIQLEKKGKVSIDPTLCVNCASCLAACKEGAPRLMRHEGPLK